MVAAEARKVNGSWWQRFKNRMTQKPTYRNPGPSRKLDLAKNFYEDFHWGEKPKKAKRVKTSPSPDVLTNIGELVDITYETSKGGEEAHWNHTFGEEGGQRPKLAVDPRNKRLHIVGGDYTVTAKGIEN